MLGDRRRPGQQSGNGAGGPWAPACRPTVGDANDTREAVEQDDAPSEGARWPA